METKLSKLKAAAARMDWVSALRIAAKFPLLGEHKESIQRAWSAVKYPDFYRDMGKDPESLIAEGIDALKVRYGI